MADLSAKIIISKLLNIIEYQAQEIKTLKAENQKLRDENNKLKGGNDKPNIRQQSKQTFSSEKERKKERKNKKPKNNKKNIKIDHTVELTVDTNVLPENAVFKGIKQL